MKKYQNRTLIRMMAQFILDHPEGELSHRLLRDKKDDFSLCVPNKNASQNSTIQAYYSLMSNVKELLLEEKKKVLLNIRGLGYKLAEETEKNPESFSNIEKASLFAKKSCRIMMTVDTKILDEEGKQLAQLLTVHSRLLTNVFEDLVRQLKERYSLPNRIEKKLIECKK